MLIGKETADGVQPVAHVRDRTSGPITYGAGRVIELQFADDTKSRIDWIDFNYAVALPCAFTNFVTCPVVPPENQLDFEVLAGEKRMLAKARQILISELALAEKTDEEQASVVLDEVLAS